MILREWHRPNRPVVCATHNAHPVATGLVRRGAAGTVHRLVNPPQLKAVTIRLGALLLSSLTRGVS